MIVFWIILPFVEGQPISIIIDTNGFFDKNILMRWILNFVSPDHKKRSRSRYIFPGLILPAIACVAIILVYFYLARLGFDYEWHWNRAWRHFGSWAGGSFKPGPLFEGLVMTIAIAASGIFFSSVLGLVICVMRLGPWPLCQWLAKCHIALIRNTPFLLQLFFVYFLLSPILHFGPLTMAILALSIFESAYTAELFRAAFLSVSRTQWEAALSLGFSPGKSLFHVILPQAFRNALPAITNQAITIIKDTSLVSAIAVADLTLRAQAIVAETFLAFEIWLLAGMIYLLLAFCVSIPGLILERRQAWR